MNFEIAAHLVWFRPRIPVTDNILDRRAISYQYPTI
jgi:hypothetical protein